MKEPLRTTEVIQVIHTVVLVGSGSQNDIYRDVHRYFAFDGTFLAENDPASQPTMLVMLPPGSKPNDVDRYVDALQGQGYTKTPMEYRRQTMRHKGVGAVATWSDTGGLQLYVGDATKEWPEP